MLKWNLKVSEENTCESFNTLQEGKVFSDYDMQSQNHERKGWYNFGYIEMKTSAGRDTEVKGKGQTGKSYLPSYHRHSANILSI